MDPTKNFPVLSLYERLGIMNFSSSELVRLRVEDLEKQHGEDFRLNLSVAMREKLVTAVKILDQPEAKQRYDSLLRATFGIDHVVPRFIDEEEAKQTVSLASLVGIKLVKIAELTYQVEQERTEATTKPATHSNIVTIGNQKIEFRSVPFTVETKLNGQPTSIYLYTDPPQFVPFTFKNASLLLRPSNEGTAIMVSADWIGNRLLFAACANHTLHGSTYIEQAAGEIFDGSVTEIAQRFEVRAKKDRIKKLIMEFHNGLVEFAAVCSGDFVRGINKETLMHHLNRHSYFFR